eukprot:513346_1
MPSIQLVDEIITIFAVDRYPLVSIVLPMYNAEHYICASIDSIINQTYLNWELIIINDGSTDNSLHIIHSKYINNYPNINLISLKQNVGIVKALNIGISKCNPNAQYIARMDADDISSHNRIETQIKFMINNPVINVLGTNVSVFDSENGKILKTINYKCLNTLSIKWCCLFFCPMNHPTIVFRNINNNNIIHYDGLYKHCEDYHLWFKLLFEYNYKFANLNKSYLKLRKNQTKINNINISNKYHNKQLNNSIQLIYDYISQRLLFDNEISMDIIECIRHPHKIKDLLMFKKCYNLLEKWEQFILKNININNNNKDDVLFIKNDCDARLGELISLCMRLYMMNAIQMMQKWKLRKPNKKLIQNIL